MQEGADLHDCEMHADAFMSTTAEWRPGETMASILGTVIGKTVGVKPARVGPPCRVHGHQAWTDGYGCFSGYLVASKFERMFSIARQKRYGWTIA